jgi:hypothetical protein
MSIATTLTETPDLSNRLKEGFNAFAFADENDIARF